MTEKESQGGKKEDKKGGHGATGVWALAILGMWESGPTLHLKHRLNNIEE